MDTFYRSALLRVIFYKKELSDGGINEKYTFTLVKNG